MSLRVIAIAAIVIGFVVEITLVAQVGNGIAAAGILLFVYDYLRKPQGPKL